MGVIAQKYGVYWIWKLLDTEEGYNYKIIRKFCGDSNYTFDIGMCGGATWHTPLRWWTEHFMVNAPEQNENTLQWYFDPNHVDWFCFVRNPYDRMLSEYKYRNGLRRGHKLYNGTGCTAQEMNEWLKENVNELGAKELDNHLTPESEYVFDSNGKQIIKHVLRYENLRDELEQLFTEYNLKEVYHDLMDKKIMPLGKGGECKNSTELTISKISEENKAIIRERFRADFEAFGYSE